jgi:hypothetical protein
MKHMLESTNLDRLLKRSQGMDSTPAQTSTPTKGQQPSQQPPSKARSKYEMNLAEFPLAILSKQAPKGLKIIESRDTKTKVIQYKDTIKGKNGELVPRHWTVSPSPRYGFGSPELLSLLFELFQIWKEQGFASPNIRFNSLAYLIQRLQLQKGELVYERLRKDLTVLVEISIEATNAFWDNEKQAYVDAVFHLFEEVHFYHKEASSRQDTFPLAYIKASEKLFGSIQANALTTLQLGSTYFHALTPTEQRVALYLAKVLYHKTSYRRDVAKLAEQLPIYATRPRDVKKQLSRACDGLLAKNFPHLTAYHYEPKRKGQRRGQGENIVFYKKAEQRERRRVQAHDKDLAQIEDLVKEILAVTGDRQNTPWYQLVAQKLDPDTIYTALAETKYAAHQRAIRTSPARYFTDLIKRYAEQQGIILNPRRPS